MNLNDNVVEAAKEARFWALIAEAEASYARGDYEEVADHELDAWMAARGTLPRE